LGEKSAGEGLVVGTNCWQKISKLLTVSLLATLIAIQPFHEQSALAAFGKIGLPGNKSVSKLAGKISEASPPEVIQELREALDDYQPQVKILSPKLDEVLDDTTVSVRFQVNDLPLFKDEKLGLGPHLHVFLDDQPYQPVYSTQQPLVLEKLTPGTHTLRVFASRPWHESFKNEGAYAQTTFHIYTKTQTNRPNPDLPLVTYSRPQGNYGAEPIMLDFYLTKAPLHLVAQEDTQDDIDDWRIRVTANGNSFILDRWQPIYLKGFKPGKNWVQVEYLDEKGNSIQNVFNNTARLITLEPGGQDALSRLVRGELSAAEARGIVDPNYVAPVVKQPEPEPSPEPSPKLESKPAVEPKADRVKRRETTPIPLPIVPTETKAADTKKPDATVDREQPTSTTKPKAIETSPEFPKQPGNSRTNRWLDKLRQSRPAKESKTEQPEKPEIKVSKPTPKPSVEPVSPEKKPILVEPKPEPIPFTNPAAKSGTRPSSKPATIPAPEAQTKKLDRTVTAAPKVTAKPSQPIPQKPTPVKEPIQLAPKPGPEVAAPKVTPTPEKLTETTNKPAKTKVSPVKSWFDQIREQIDSRKATSKTLPSAKSVPSVEATKPQLQNPDSTPIPQSSPTVELPKTATTASRRQQPAKDYYEQLRRPAPATPVKPGPQEFVRSGESKPTVGSTPPPSLPDERQRIPSDLSAPGRNVPLVE
jgi:hypothetical protein